MSLRRFAELTLLLALVCLAQSQCPTGAAQKCRGEEFTHIFINLERRGLASILLTNLTQSEYNLHCELFSKYSSCVAQLDDECKTLLHKDPLFEGVQDYYSYLCSKPRDYQDYTKATQCKQRMMQLDVVQSCDSRVSHINLHPSPNSGMCSPLSSWMQCYTEAVSTQCAVSGPEGTSSAIYVLSAQQKLIGKLAVAAACQGQEFTRITVADSVAPASSGGGGGGGGWVVAVVLAMLVVIGVMGVLVFIVYRRRGGGGSIPRQRLVNEPA